MVQLPIYMDNHATTRVDSDVLKSMLPYFTEKFGNAASINHSFGWEAGDAVETARSRVARLLNAMEAKVIFTSGATEANNIALKGVMRAACGAKPVGHLVTNAGEHRAVLDPARKLKRDGFEITILPVDQYGMVDPTQVVAAIQSNTVLVSVMMANNEVGTINPIDVIGRICRDREILFHCDMVQAIGTIPVDLSALPVDLLSLTAHKFYGPKGIGALVIRRGSLQTKIEPLFEGGGHENRIRSGTLPVPLVVGFGKCCELASERMDEEAIAIGNLRERLWRGLQNEVDNIRSNGHPTERLAGNLNVSFEGVDGDALMTRLKDIAVSSGAACTSVDPEPSHVLRAMGISDVLTRASLRFGLGRFNTTDEVDYAVSAVGESVKRLRKLAARGA